MFRSDGPHLFENYASFQQWRRRAAFACSRDIMIRNMHFRIAEVRKNVIADRRYLHVA